MEGNRSGRQGSHARPSGSVLDGGDLGAIYRLHRESVLRYVSRTFGAGPPDPDDVVQEAFERYALAAAAERVLNPRAFLMRSAHNYVIDQKRRQKVSAEHARTTQATIVHWDEIHAERDLVSRQRWAILRQAIAELDDRSREILIMNRMQDLSCAEIARRRQCSPTLVKAVLARALLACHDALAEADGQ